MCLLPWANLITLTASCVIARRVMATQSITPKPVLLVDDSADDAVLMRRAFRKAGLDNPLVHLQDGETAIVYMKGCIERAEPLPILILLDIKMPRMDGFETLAWVKTCAQLAKVPAVMLTSSSLNQDMTRAKELGADGFLTKPPTLEDLTNLVREVQKRWLIID